MLSFIFKLQFIYITEFLLQKFIEVLSMYQKIEKFSWEFCSKLFASRKPNNRGIRPIIY